MKILWYVDKYFDSTLDQATWLEIIKHFQRSNDVFLVTGYKREKIQFEELNNKVIYLQSLKIPFLNRTVFYYNQLKCFESFIREYKPERILFNTNNFLLLKKSARKKQKYGYKCFLDIRTLPVSPSRAMNIVDNYLFKKSLKIASTSFDGITYITEEIKNYCREKYDLPRHKTEIWNSGADIHSFTPAGGSDNEKKFRIIYHGTINKNRGIDNVIKALHLLKDYDIELLLVGSGGGLKQLKKLSSKLSLDSRVNFHPPVPYKEVPRYICLAHVGVLPFPDCPGWNTSSPIKLFEYLSCGKPVIATRIPAHINVLQGKDFVFWADKSSPAEIADAIREAYVQRAHYKNRAKKAREYVIDNYDWEIQARKFEQFIMN